MMMTPEKRLASDPKSASRLASEKRLASTGCVCDGPQDGERVFWCERHKRRKTANHHRLCKTDLGYWNLWEGNLGDTVKTKANGRPRRKPKTPDVPTAELEAAAEEFANLTGMVGWSAVDLATRYARALARWVAAGRPVRTDDEVAQIFEEHCRPCQRYDAEKEVCTACGCRVGVAGMAIRNKPKMATEKCPLGKW